MKELKTLPWQQCDRDEYEADLQDDHDVLLHLSQQNDHQWCVSVSYRSKENTEDDDAVYLDPTDPNKTLHYTTFGDDYPCFDSFKDAKQAALAWVNKHIAAREEQ
jgi:hypothetical protein